MPFGLLFGRLANFANGELWGREAGPGVPWAMVFPGGGPVARHPSQLYEAILEGLVLAIVLLVLFWKTRARWRPGLLVGTFTLGYALSRFTVEFFREPDAQLLDLAMQSGLSMGQWLTIPMMGTPAMPSFTSGRKAMRASAMAASDPRRPARGIRRLT